MRDQQRRSFADRSEEWRHIIDISADDERIAGEAALLLNEVRSRSGATNTGVPASTPELPYSSKSADSKIDARPELDEASLEDCRRAQPRSLR
jgi:hypothetical protein